MQHVNSCHSLEELAGNIIHGAVATRCKGDLAGISFGVGDEFRQRLRGVCRIHHHDEGGARDAGDRRDVADEIEIQFRVEAHIGNGRRADQEQRVAVGGRASDRFGRDIGAGARAVLDDDLLAEPLRERLADDARDDVGRRAGGKADDQMHRPRRIGIRPCDPRNSRERGSARCQVQKFSAGKCHGFFSPKCSSMR